MPKRKTLPAVSTDSVSSEDSILTKKTGNKMFRTISKHHVNAALTIYLRSMSLIDDNEHVTNFNKAPNALDVKIEKEH